MSIENQVPDYDLADDVEVSTPARLRAMADPLRSTVLDLLLERTRLLLEIADALADGFCSIGQLVGPQEQERDD